MQKITHRFSMLGSCSIPTRHLFQLAKIRYRYWFRLQLSTPFVYIKLLIALFDFLKMFYPYILSLIPGSKRLPENGINIFIYDSKML